MIALCACKQSKPIAELKAVSGADLALRQQGDAGAWQTVQPGAGYFVDDAAQTRDATATLDVGRGGAEIVMDPHTVLRFRKDRIIVEDGEIELSGTGRYTLNVGDIELPSPSTVRVRSPRAGRPTIDLVIGVNARVVAHGQTYTLEIGTPVDLGEGPRPPIDAGVAAPDGAAAPADAPDDATAVAEATIEVTGKRAEVLAPGDTAWKPLPAGMAPLARGSAVRLGAGTTARVTAGGTTLELAGGARILLGDDLAFALVTGGARVAATQPAAIALPGGAIALGGAEGARAEARLDTTPRDTRVTLQRGGGKLTGAPGTDLAMNRGDIALLTRSGAIRVVEAVPSFFDFRVAAGESLTIHDPRPPTALQFQFDGKCPEGGIIEIDRDFRFRTAKVSGGRDFANLLIGPGTWSYRLRCTRNGDEGGAVASGRVSVMRDDGRRPLPRLQGVNDIDADGRNYRISYQSAIPNLVVHVKSPGATHKLHLASSGKEQTFDSATPSIPVPGAQLREGTYTYWIDRDGVKQDRVSSLTIDFDQTAPQVYIESPGNGQPWTGDIDVRGAVLPGWSAAVEGFPIPIDKQRRFAAKVGAPGGNALAIQLSHPQHGVHYYLRRPK